jgi:CheY-like chemotaxis protein
MLRSILERTGHEILEAEDGYSAIQCYLHKRPHLAMLDLVMHGMPGLEALRRLREADQRARVVVATADIQIITKALALHIGAIDYVTKPFAQERVLRAVQSALNGD